MGIINSITSGVSNLARTVVDTVEGEKPAAPAAEAPKTAPATPAASEPTSTPTLLSKAEAALTKAKDIGAKTLESAVNSKLTAQITADPIAPASTTTANLADTEARKKLLADAPQINDVSKKAGNSNDVCGGAATVSALVMTEKGGKNARALESTLQENHVRLSSKEQEALDHFKGGNLSPADVQQLQQATYRLGHAVQGDEQQLNPGTMGAMQAQLKKNGAYAGSDVTFHQTQVGPPNADGSPANHWTVSANGTHVDTGFPDKSHVDAKTPSDIPTRPADPKFRGEVSVTDNPPRLSVDYKDSSTTGSQYKHAEVNPDPRLAGPWAVADSRIADAAKDAKPVDANDEASKAKATLQEASKKDDGVLSVNDDNWIRENVTPQNLRYASADDKLHMIKILKSGVYSDDDKKTVNMILSSAASEQERAALNKAAN